jgi:methionyl-tRNA formyltransferase
MSFEKIAILTSEISWFVPYSQRLAELLSENGFDTKVYFQHENVDKDCEIVFLLSYFRLVKKEFLENHKHNIVVHESNLPEGKGWAPLFWQILENKNKIPIVLFEANEKVDDGNIYLKDFIVLEGHELNPEIRKKQAIKTIEMCLEFLKSYDYLKHSKQEEAGSFYRKRTPEDSELNPDRTIKEQFNLLRIVDNEEYPAFFYYKGHKYFIKIYEDFEG